MENIRQVGPGYYIWYQSRGWLVLRWGGLWYPTSEASVQSQGFMSSAGRWPVVRFLERQVQKCIRITKNKTVRAVRPKADNIRRVGLGYYIYIVLVENWASSIGFCQFHDLGRGFDRLTWVNLVFFFSSFLIEFIFNFILKH